MDTILAASIVCLICLFFGYQIGSMDAKTSVSGDCQLLESFRINSDVYACKLIKQKIKDETK